MTDTKPQRLIRASDIAALADVSPAAVSNWRSPSRGLGFPEAAGGTTARPLFRYDEVVTWLVENGREVRELTPEHDLWTLMDSARDALPPDQFAPVVLPLLCLRKAANDSTKVRATWREIMKSEPSEIQRCVWQAIDAAESELAAPGLFTLPTGVHLNGWWAYELLRSLDAYSADQLPGVADQLLSRTARSLGRGAGEQGVVGSQLSRLLASLATRVVRGSASRIATVYDPACGIAETLLRAARRDGTLNLRGADVSEVALTTARQRFYLAGLTGRATFTQANTIETDPNPGLKADAVVLEPPFGMRSTELGVVLSDPRWRFGTPKGAAADLAWLQDAIAHLGDTGRGFVVSLGGPLFASGALREIRQELLRQGCVEAVIELPSNVLIHTMAPLFIWVLRAPAAHAGGVVWMVDASSTQQTLFQDADLPTYLDAVNDFVGGLVPATSVPVTELLKDDASLIPHEWVHTSSYGGGDATDEYWKSVNRLVNVLEALDREDFPADVGELDFSRVRVLTIRSLVRDGYALLTKGRVAPGEGGVLPADVVRPEHIRKGLPSIDETVAGEQGVTEPGDILFTTMHDVHACVDREGGRRVSRQIYILRLSAESGSAPDFVAHCLMAPWNRRFQMGSAITRAKPDALEVPVPPIDVQRRIAEALSSVAVVKQLAAAADDYAAALLNASRYGADLTSEPTYDDETDEGTE